jgi:hypothetical protein
LPPSGGADRAKEEPKMQAIEIELRDIYGETKAYPANEQAKIFAQLVGTKTLTHNTLCLIERLGFEIKTKQRGWNK